MSPSTIERAETNIQGDLNFLSINTPTSQDNYDHDKKVQELIHKNTNSVKQRHRKPDVLIGFGLQARSPNNENGHLNKRNFNIKSDLDKKSDYISNVSSAIKSSNKT